MIRVTVRKLQQGEAYREAASVNFKTLDDGAEILRKLIDRRKSDRSKSNS